MLKKYVKYILITLLLILNLIGCEKQESTYNFKQYGFQPPVKGLYWGMPTNELKEVPSLKEKLKDATYETYDDETTITLSDKMKKFGYPASVVIKIDPAIEQGWYPYHTDSLRSIQFVYTNVDSDKLKKNMMKEFGQKGNDWTQIVTNYACTTWESKDEIKDMTKEDIEKWNALMKLIDQHQGASKHKASDNYINKVILTIPKDKTVASVEYDGYIACTINKLNSESTTE